MVLRLGGRFSCGSARLEFFCDARGLAVLAVGSRGMPVTVVGDGFS